MGELRKLELAIFPRFAYFVAVLLVIFVGCSCGEVIGSEEYVVSSSNSNQATAAGVLDDTPRHSAIENLPIVEGSIFCSDKCLNQDSPVVGAKVKLLCPHPPPGDGPRSDLLQKEVSTAFSDGNGAFRLAADASSIDIMHRCAVIISKGSSSNCDLPPDSGDAIPIPSSSSSRSDNRISLGSFSFQSDSCSVEQSTTGGKGRALLRSVEISLTERQHVLQERTRDRISGPEIPRSGSAQDVAHQLQNEPFHPSKSGSENLHSNSFPRRTSKLRQGLNLRTSSMKDAGGVLPPTVIASSKHHTGNHGGGPPHTVSANRHHRYRRGGPPTPKSCSANSSKPSFPTGRNRTRSDLAMVFKGSRFLDSAVCGTVCL